MEILNEFSWFSYLAGLLGSLAVVVIWRLHTSKKNLARKLEAQRHTTAEVRGELENAKRENVRRLVAFAMEYAKLRRRKDAWRQAAKKYYRLSKE